MPTTIDVTDLYSRKGARLLAELIANYWLRKGHIVLVESFQIPESEHWGVRSNLVNGLPRSTRESAQYNSGWTNRLAKQLAAGT